MLVKTHKTAEQQLNNGDNIAVYFFFKVVRQEISNPIWQKMYNVGKFVGENNLKRQDENSD